MVSIEAQNVTFIARDFNGVEQCRVTRAFAAFEHIAFLTADFLPCAVGNTGVLEAQAAGIGGLSGVAFLAADQGLGAFVTLPVWGPEL